MRKCFTKLWTKAQVKETIKALKEAGYKVVNEGSPSDRDGHFVKVYCDEQMAKEDMVFSAMINSCKSTYLCRIAEGLFEGWNG